MHDKNGNFTREELFLISEALSRQACEYPVYEDIHITLMALSRRATHKAVLSNIVHEDNPYEMESYCVKCQATTPEARYPHQLHTTGMMEWTCCACLGHGYKDDGICTQIPAKGSST